MTAKRLALGAAAVSAIIALAGPLVSRFEGERRVPYQDLNGIWTVCRGETHVEMRTYSPAECEAMFVKSLTEHGQDVQQCLPDDLPPRIAASAWSIGYNMGATKFCKTNFAKRLRAGERDSACAAISELTTINDGKVDCSIPANRCRGIVLRRASEQSLCEGRA